jgi:hypothetical protein
MVFGTTENPILCTAGPCPGHPDHLSARRAELSGIAASVFLLHTICLQHQIANGSVILYNNSTKVQKLINHPGRKFKHFLEDDCDLLAEIRTNMQQLRHSVNLSLIWVKGHYKRNNREIQHDLNDATHSLAVAALPSSSQDFCCVAPPTSLIDLKHHHSLTSNWQAILRETAHLAPLHHANCKQTSWMTEQFDMVDWDAMKLCLKCMPQVCQLSYCKLLHSLLNTNAQNNRYYQTTNLCPHCQEGPESFQHMVLCCNPDIKKRCNAQQLILWQALDKLCTPKPILDSLKQGIESYTLGEAVFLSHTTTGPVTTDSYTIASPIHTIPNSVDAAHQSQTMLGWEYLLC